MAELPTGTVTFLFTDIEGSTQLWEHYPDAMTVALARHDAVLRESIERHHGYVFKTVGDAFCAAFTSAGDGLNAALTAQRALFAETWGDTPIKVRMALHSGLSEERDNDYFGPQVNRVARLLSAGHGGQTLISAATEELLRGALPANLQLRDMGERRLKDLIRPEHVYQLVSPDLPADFAPLKTLDMFRTNLPAQWTSFIGRDKEMADVKKLLRTNRLVTLTGVGGTGKTRLSLQVASTLPDNFADGIWFVELAALTDPALILPSTASVLDLREGQGQPLLIVLTNYLRAKTALIIFDNCEHVIDGCAQFAATILRAAPQVRILTSSREPLCIDGEVTYRVPPLAVPDPHRFPSHEALTQYDAIRLFMERAKAVMPSFEVTSVNAVAVAQLCQHLDGIPLAIELAAARVRGLKVEQLAQRLSDRFRLLAGGNRTALPHHQTLRALIDWSYELLTEPERRLFRRLSVFAGGWTIEASEVVCAGDGIESSNVLDMLLHLVDKSLIVMDEQSSETRYHMLETIREYAASQLCEAEEADHFRLRQVTYFLAMAESTHSKLTSPAETVWLEQLQRNHDNLRAALQWSEQSDRIELNLRLASALWWFWNLSSYFEEGAQQLAHSASLALLQHYPLERAQALAGSGAFAWLRGDYSVAYSLLEQSLDLARAHELAGQHVLAWALLWQSITALRVGHKATAQTLATECIHCYRSLTDAPGLSFALFVQGRIALESGDYDFGQTATEESYHIAHAIPFDYCISLALSSLGQIALQRRDLSHARAVFEERMKIVERTHDKWAVGNLRTNLAELDQIQRCYASALLNYQQSLDIAVELDNSGDTARRLCCVGIVEYHLGNMTSAHTHLLQSLTLFRQQSFTRGIAECLLGFALLRVEKDPPAAATLLRTSNSLLAQVGAKRWSADQVEYENLLARLKFLLTLDEYQQIESGTCSVTMEQAIELALSDKE